MSEIISSHLFSIVLCILAFQIGTFIYGKTKLAFLNPILIAIGIIIMMLQVLHMPLEVFKENTEMINLFLGPATVVLAVPMYTQREVLKKNLLPILIATSVGALTAIGSVILLGRLFRLEESFLISFIPKSVTTPIAVEVSESLGGIPSITVAAVIITGIVGAVLAPSLIKLLGLKNKVAIGLAIGASSHAVGTSKAVEMGEVEGALSGLAIGIVGIFTVFMSLFL